MIVSKRFEANLRQREALTGWLFVLPELLGFCVFTFFSIGYSFYISLTKYELLSPPTFVGLRNYWDWEKKDAYMPAGAIISNIEDMLIFSLKIQIYTLKRIILLLKSTPRPRNTN